MRVLRGGGVRVRAGLERRSRSGHVLLRRDLRLRSGLRLPRGVRLRRLRTAAMMETRAIIEDVLRQERPAMVAFVRKRAGHIVDPEDVLQQAALRALSKSEQLREPAVARAWVYRIVRNVLADELRALGLPVAVVDDAEAISDAVQASAHDVSHEGETCRCAMELAKTLKPEYAAILERAVIEERPVTAIAAELGLTANNATVRLHRARKALRSLLEQHCGTTSLRECLDCGCEERGCCSVR